jgi:putative transposase
MVRYRRNFVARGTFFFTVALQDRRSDLLVRHIDLLRKAFDVTRSSRPFHTEALVVLPDHIHAVWTLPPGDSDFAGRWRAIKSRFVRDLFKAGVPMPRNARGEALIWQQRFWEHTIRDEADYRSHVDYIHFNPVKHGLAVRPADWPYSTFHRYVAQGDLSVDWAGEDEFEVPSAGEPR